MANRMVTVLERGLTGTEIKLIAMVLMVLDHLYYFFQFTGDVPILFTWLGRMVGWMFLFLLVEGFIHTKNRLKHFWRIWLIGAGMGTINYLIKIFLARGDLFSPQNNIFATFTVLLIIWQGLDLLKRKKVVRGFLLICLPFVLTFFYLSLPLDILSYVYLLETTVFPLPFLTEGGIPYIIGGILLFLLRWNRKLQIAVFGVFLLLWNGYVGISTGVQGFGWLYQFYEWMGIFSLIFMCLYNEKRGRNLKHLFYAFYPLHVYILYFASYAQYIFYTNLH